MYYQNLNVTRKSSTKLLTIKSVFFFITHSTNNYNVKCADNIKKCFFFVLTNGCVKPCIERKKNLQFESNLKYGANLSADGGRHRHHLVDVDALEVGQEDDAVDLCVFVLDHGVDDHEEGQGDVGQRILTRIPVT